MVHVIQNEALVDICKKKLRLDHPTYSDLNRIVSKAISNITCGIRFPGQINSNMRKQAVNLIPYPRLHFFMDSITPLTKTDDRTRKYDTVEAMTDLFDLNTSTFLCEADPRHGRYMTASAIIRGGKISSWEVEKQCKKIIDKNSSYFFEWIPDNIETSLCDVPFPG
jgi:tubulin beta